MDRHESAEDRTTTDGSTPPRHRVRPARRGACALGLAAGLAGLLTAVAACAGGGSTSGSGASGGGSVTAGSTIRVTTTTPPATGDVAKVTWALPTGEPSTLDPVKTGDYSPNTVVLNMCEPLLRLNPDFSVSPGLAANWSQPNPTTLIFNIRAGLKFWDGHPLTAQDVAYSLQRNMIPADGAVNAQLFAAVKSITATGPLQVTVTFNRHNAAFLDTMADVAAAVSEKSYVESKGQAYGTPGGGLMCTGPFKFGQWDSGSKIVMYRNDDYWGTKAKAAEFDFDFITDDNTLTSALLAGQVDGTYLVPISGVAKLKDSSSGKLYYGPSTESLSIGPVSATGPMADPRVREALDLAIDKTTLIKNVLRGAGTPQKTFTPPLVWAGDPAKAIYQAGYDALPDSSGTNLAKAKQLIAAAGASGKTLVLVIPSGNQMLLETATIVQADAEAIGLTVKIQQMQPTTYSELFYDPAKRAGIDLTVTEGYIEVPGAFYYAPGFVLPGAIFNWTNWSNPQVTALVAAGMAATSPQVEARDFVAAQKIFAPADLQITLAGLYNRLYMSDSITGAPASFAYINSAWAAEVGKA